MSKFLEINIIGYRDVKEKILVNVGSISHIAQFDGGVAFYVDGHENIFDGTYDELKKLILGEN